MATFDNRRIEMVALGTIEHWPRNPKDHDLGAMHASIKRHGFVEPMVRDDRTGRLVAGHGRDIALKQMKASGEPVPAGIEERDGEWFVPVELGVRFESDADAESYIVASHRVGELGGWLEPQLAIVLGDLATDGLLEGTGFDGDDVDYIIKTQADDLRADYDFLGDPGQEDAAPLEQKAFPLAIVLTVDEHKRWQAHKKSVKTQDDRTAFMALWRSVC